MSKTVKDITRYGDGHVYIRYEDGSLYDGEYIGGRITGEGFFDYADGRTYEGHFVNGTWDGYGKATFGETESYEGYWKNNLREGKGETSYYDDDGNLYKTIEGKYHKDVLSGEATMWWKDGSVLIGRFKGDEPASTMRMHYGKDFSDPELRDVTYEGEMLLRNNSYIRYGRGKLTYPDGSTRWVTENESAKRTITYESVLQKSRQSDTAGADSQRSNGDGNNIRTLPDGTVEIKYSDGAYYKGEYIGGHLTGKGYMKYADGKEYLGEFDNGAWNGKGKATFYSDGIISEVYDGHWKNNKREGSGKTIFYDSQGAESSVTVGIYHKDVLDGRATRKWQDGSEMSGVFKNHSTVGTAKMIYGTGTDLNGYTYEGQFVIADGSYQRTGTGKLTDPDGTVFEGVFRDGSMDGTFTVTYPDGTMEEAVYSKGTRVSASAEKKSKEVRKQTAKKETSKEETPKVEFVKDTDKYLSVQTRDQNRYSPEIRQYFEGIIGMDSVKDQMDKMFKRFRIDKMRRSALGVSGPAQGYYFILTGNPGTGKTTVARIVGKMLHDLGFIEGDTFVEVDRAKLVGEYIGQTAQRTTNCIQSARGGTLFIDEAYTLFKKNDEKDFGREAIDTLLKDMEDHRGEYCVILAGYANEMADMIRNANPGLASRFDHKLTIEDYSEDEMVDILITMADSRRFLITKDSREAIIARINKEKIDDTFDNARFARRLLDEAVERQAVRLMENMDSIGQEDLQVLISDDFGAVKTEESSLEACLKKLDSLIGLASVKNEVNRFVRAIRIQNESKKRGLAIAGNTLSVNMVFTGNPGTGKTTVARLLSQIYYQLGVLKRPDVFVECVRADLVGRYQGETAQKVKDVVRRSLGGILFVDEAYSLVMNESDSFGLEAVNTLVSEIENNRDKLAVIMAGYTKEMNEFLDSNPGLRSRLPNIIEFPDYSPEELAQIFRLTLKNRGYTVEVTDEALLPVINRERVKKDFGNARGVRNICDSVISRQNERINGMDFDEISNEVILTITDEDLI